MTSNESLLVVTIRSLNSAVLSPLLTEEKPTGGGGGEPSTVTHKEDADASILSPSPTQRLVTLCPDLFPC